MARPDRDRAAGATQPGVTFVLPVHNGARWLDDVLAAIWRQAYRGPIEVIAVDDGSTDDSRRILERHAECKPISIVDGPRRGATAALNAGVALAVHPLIAQIDQDVVIEPDWLARLVAALRDDPALAAAQGHYVAASDAGLWSRVMALDLRVRYSTLHGNRTDHVCTGNSVYRTAALRDVGPFDDELGYGYDNDMSYRLTDAGYRLAHVPEARSTHHWREGLLDYARQQYGFGYGRLDLVAKHRHRAAGDDVSRLAMMLHAPVMAASLALALVAGLLAALGLPSTVPAIAAVALLGAILLERLVAGVRASVRFGHASGLWFMPVHVIRDLAWVAAIGVWSVRRLRGGRSRPSDSMRPRKPDPSVRNLPGA